MDEETETVVMLLVIAVGAAILNQPARRRETILADINRVVGDPRVVPIHDGDHFRTARELRRLYDRLLPTWLARP